MKGRTSTGFALFVGDTTLTLPLPKQTDDLDILCSPQNHPLLSQTAESSSVVVKEDGRRRASCPRPFLRTP